jgi:hypothetical protein
MVSAVCSVTTGRHRLAVPHLADHDHVGVLADGRPQRVGEVQDVDADLALADV